MTIGIMQPYLFPYIGYFQLMNAVDLFGIGDDVQYIKSGWVNRNRILVKNETWTFTFPMRKDSSSKIIKERYLHEDVDMVKKKLIRILKLNYKNAPYFPQTIELIEFICNYNELNLSLFLTNHLEILSTYLGIKTSFLNSKVWMIEDELELTSEERVIKKLDKVKRLGVKKFVNPIGGRDLYSKPFFKANGFELSFLAQNNIKYKQSGDSFIPNLSIIDVMMFNSPEQIRSFLNQYELK